MDFKLMEALCFADGVSSDEEEVAAILENAFESNGLTVERDRFGNVFGYKRLGERPVVLAAHMDEIGFMVKHVEKNGFLRFIKIGGIDDRLLPDQVVRVKGRSKVWGVIGMKPPHITKQEERKSVVEWRRLFIDVGAESREEVEELGIEVGSTATFAPFFRRAGKHRFMGKALDNRIGCYILTQLSKNLPENVVLMGTAQEEVSTFGKGATVAAYRLNPSAFIAVDTTTAGDHPEVSEHDAPIALAKGPAVVLAEAGGRGNVADRKLLKRFVEVAKEGKISIQPEVMEGGATDAASVYNVREGIPSISISVPCRYIHSRAALADVRDVESTLELLSSFLKS